MIGMIVVISVVIAILIEKKVEATIIVTLKSLPRKLQPKCQTQETNRCGSSLLQAMQC